MRASLPAAAAPAARVPRHAAAAAARRPRTAQHPSQRRSSPRARAQSGGQPNGSRPLAAGSAAGGDGSGASSGGGDGSGASSGGSGGSNGSGGGSQRAGGGGEDGPQQPHTRLSSRDLALGAAALAAATSLVGLAVMLQLLQSQLTALWESLAGMADGASTRESVARVKRLLREVFAEQLALKQRLAAAEQAATLQLEAADEYQQEPGSWSRAPVRATGDVCAAGVLPWSQEPDSRAALAMLAALGAGGAADMRLQLHSVLAGGKRRVTAELRQAPHEGTLRLARLLYRVHARHWLQLMIAPLGGGLDALGCRLTPVRGDFGCTHALRCGHGLTALDHTGSGKAIRLTRRWLSAAAGFFVTGSSKTGIAHLQAKSSGGHALSVVAAHRRLRPASSSSSSSSSNSSAGATSPGHGAGGLRFLGTQAPHIHQAASSSDAGSPEPGGPAGPLLGVVGVLPVGDALTATAWAERQPRGAPGWGFGLFSQPDRQGVELGMVLGRPGSQQHAAWRSAAPPLFCELSAKVPAGDGLSIAPGALLTRRNGATSLAYVMQSSWRW